MRLGSRLLGREMSECYWKVDIDEDKIVKVVCVCTLVYVYMHLTSHRTLPSPFTSFLLALLLSFHMLLLAYRV